MASRERESTTISALLAKYGGSIKTGPFGTALKAKEYSKDGVHLISVGEIGYGTFRISDSTPRVPKEVVDRLPEYLLQTNDIVFGRKGGVDRSAIVKPEQAGWFLGSDGIRLRLPDTCDASFIAYQLQSLSSRDWIIQHATGTTMASLNQEVVGRIPIVLPPIDEQRRISHILGALDDTIELNRQLNATLEQLARSLFQSWFLDFDPVRAKASGEPEESICRRLGLTPELLALFPAALEESAMGKIPVGWSASTVDEEFNLIMGQSPPGDTYNSMGHGLPFYQGRTDFGFRFPTHRIYCTAPTRYASIGDTLISVRAPVGDINMANERCAIGRGVASARHKSGSRIYTYEMMRNLKPKFDSFNGEGTVFGSINKKSFHDMRCIAPDQSAIEAFDRMLGAVESSVENNELESRTLAALRDELLPKLLSGEIRLN